MSIATSVTRRDRKRKLLSGQTVIYTRYVLNFRDPRTGKRRQVFCQSQREAIAKRDNLLAAIATNTYAASKSNLTVGDATRHRLSNRQGEVKEATMRTYRAIATNLVVGPVLLGTPAERKLYREAGTRPEGALFIEALGPSLISDLSTAEIRAWHRTLVAHVRTRSGAMAKTILCASLALAAEDYGVRPPPMPTKLGRGKPKSKRTLLTPEQVGRLLQGAREDKARGIFAAWPFLTGTRPSEQLGLLWEDIDLERNIARVCRVQERDGTLTETTKTSAGVREIPLGPTLREMLVAWREVCPRRDGELHRVFPGVAGGALTYWNWRNRYFKPAMAASSARRWSADLAAPPIRSPDEWWPRDRRL